MTSIDLNYGRLGIENHGYFTAADRLPDNVDVNMRGGSLYLSNNANSATTETIGRVVLQSGMNFLFTALQAGSGVNINSVDLISQGLVKVPGSDAVVDFNGVASAVGNAGRVKFLTPPTLTNNIIGAWAIDQRNWASYVTGVGIGPLSGTGFQIYSSTNLLTALPTDNVATAFDTSVTLTADKNVFTLRMWNNAASTQTLGLGGKTLTLGGGGLMFAQNVDGGHFLASNGNLTAGTAGVGGDLHVYKLGYTANAAAGRQLTISANVVDNAGGAVRLLLNNSDAPLSQFFANNTTTLSAIGNTYTGGTVLNQGNVFLSGPELGRIIPAGASSLVTAGLGGGNQGDSTVTVANATGFKVGQVVSGVGIQRGTTITAIDRDTDPSTRS